VGAGGNNAHQIDQAEGTAHWDVNGMAKHPLFDSRIYLSKKKREKEKEKKFSAEENIQRTEVKGIKDNHRVQRREKCKWALERKTLAWKK